MNLFKESLSMWMDQPQVIGWAFENCSIEIICSKFECSCNIVEERVRGGLIWIELQMRNKHVKKLQTFALDSEALNSCAHGLQVAWASKFWGGKGGPRGNCKGKKGEKLNVKPANICFFCHFHAEIINLILKQLFWGKLGGKKKQHSMRTYTKLKVCHFWLICFSNYISINSHWAKLVGS